MSRRGWLIGLLVVSRVTPALLGQGVIVDQRESIPLSGAYEVKKVAVDASILDQVAEVQVSQTFDNPSGSTLEAEYFFPLPADGGVQSMTLLVNGKEMPGKLLDADEARSIYERIVRRKKDPALLEYAGRGLFKTSVFPIEAGQDCTVTLRYTQLCRRDRDVVDFTYPIGTHKVAAKPIGSFTADIRIRGRAPIKSVYSPSHDVKVTRQSDTEANAHLELRDIQPTGDMRLLYTVDDDEIGATLLSYRPQSEEDGYFLLLASPGFTKPDRKPQAKSVIFVLDKSGSMSGNKIDQARKAAEFVVRNLNEDDTFNIVAYDDQVETFKPELQRYDTDSRDEALAFLQNVRDGGSTDINAALTTAMGMLNDEDRPSYVLFLTDGLPTAGEQNETKIAANCTGANDVGARVIVFGVGHDVNARLLDRISTDNGGVSEYVKPDQGIEAAVSRFYRRITAPVLSDMNIELAGTQINRAYPRELPDLFEGGQLVWAGRYTDAGSTQIKVTGRIAGRQRTFTYDGTLASTSSGSAYAFVERLWAVRRVGHIINQVDLHGENDPLVDELVELSKQYGILTPYTSFLADETTDLAARRANTAVAAGSLKSLDAQVSGASGVGQRQAKAAYQKAAQAQPSGPAVRQTMEGEDVPVTTVRNIGRKTFYRRTDRWEDASLDPNAADNATEIKLFSDEYFELVRRNTAEQNQYLDFDDDLLVEIDGRVYYMRR